jgi:hypothetical protein
MVSVDEDFVLMAKKFNDFLNGLTLEKLNRMMPSMREDLISDLKFILYRIIELTENRDMSKEKAQLLDELFRKLFHNKG